MDAIVLVGGLGTRLRPLTHTRHKSLVPLCNRPAIEYLFRWLAGARIERVVLAIGQYNDDLATAYPEGEHCGLSVTHVLERTRLESGGAIRNAVQEANIEGRFLVLNGDIFAEFDLRRALEAHARHYAELTMALYPVEDTSQFGVAAVDDNDLITGFVEKPPPGTAPSNLINAGVWIFEPQLVAEIPDGAVRVEETLFPSLVARGRNVLGHRFEELWADIGTPKRYLDVGVALAGRPGAVAIHPEAVVPPTAAVSSSSLGSRTALGEGAAVSASIIWEDVSIGRDAQIESSVIADRVRIGDGAVVSGVVAGSGATIPAGVTVPPGTTIEPGCEWIAGD
jgi:mannose-1-phosphate guanylyltransferase